MKSTAKWCCRRGLNKTSAPVWTHGGSELAARACDGLRPLACKICCQLVTATNLLYTVQPCGLAELLVES